MTNAGACRPARREITSSQSIALGASLRSPSAAVMQLSKDRCPHRPTTAGSEYTSSLWFRGSSCRHRPCDAAAASQVPDLLLTALLRLPDLAQQGYTFQAWSVAHVQDRCELRAECAVSCQAGANLGAVLHQPLRQGIVWHVFQIVYREGVGRAVQPDQRRLGRPAYKGLVGLVHCDARAQETAAARPRGRHQAEGHANLADRAVPLSQTRPRADVGRSCPPG